MRYTVDVIIPSYRPDQKLTELVSMLQNQTYPVSHILIINTEEKLWNPKIVKDMDRVEVFHIRQEQFDHGRTRRMGESFSNADILVYMTQDAVPADRFLIRNLLRPFRNPQVKAAYARQLPDHDCRIVEGYTRTFNYPEKSRIKGLEDVPKLGIKTFFCSNVCAAYDHRTYKDLGGFPKRAIFNEDMIYAGQFQRNFDLAVSQVQHPEVFAGIRSESEGIRLVKQTASYLKSINRKDLIPGLVISSGFKFLGYRMGKLYRKMPRFLVKACSMNKKYWNAVVSEDE